MGVLIGFEANNGRLGERYIYSFLGVLPSWRIKFLVKNIFDRIVSYIRPRIAFREI